MRTGIACAMMRIRPDDPLALGGGEAGQRLVQEQDLGLGRERHAHVDEPLPAIGERIRRHLLDALEAEEGDQLRRLAVDLLDTVRASARALMRLACLPCMPRRMFSSMVSRLKRFVI